MSLVSLIKTFGFSILLLCFPLFGWSSVSQNDVECAYIGDVFPDLIGEDIAVLGIAEVNPYLKVGDLKLRTVERNSPRALGKPWVVFAGMSLFFEALAKPVEGDNVMKVCEGDQNHEMADFISGRRRLLEFMEQNPGGTLINPKGDGLFYEK